MQIKKKKRPHINPSIIELLCLIGIFLVLIMAGIRGIYVLSTSSVDASVFNYEKELIEASKEYTKTLEDMTIGKQKKVTLNQLIERGYLKDKVKDLKKHSCLDKSYITIYKDSNNNYQYVPYLYCDNQVIVNESARANIYFLDVVKENDKYNISNGVLYMELLGGNTNQNTAIKLSKYSYKVSVLTANNYQEIYSSGDIEVNEIKPIFIQEKLTKFVNLYQVDDMVVTVVLENIEGKRVTEEFHLKDNIF